MIETSSYVPGAFLPFSSIFLASLTLFSLPVLSAAPLHAGTAHPVVLYNPAGRKRHHLLAEALDIFREKRGRQTLCAYVKHAGRPAQQKWVGTLEEFPLDDVDMPTLVLLGGPWTIRDGDVLFERRGYADKYGIS